MSSNHATIPNLSYEDFASLSFELDLIPLFVKRYIERSSCSNICPTEVQQIEYQKAFLNRENITDLEGLSSWLKKHSLTESQFSKQLYYSLQLQLFKEQKFSDKVDRLYFDHKNKFDQVMYSMIRCSQRAKAQELFIRLRDNEDSFGHLASKYSEGSEKQVNGLIGPIELGRINAVVAERLRISKQDQLWEPFCEQGWWVILKLEKFIPSKLDESMRNRLLNDLHETWMRDCVSSELSRLQESELFTSLNPSALLKNTTDFSKTSKRPSLISKLLSKFNPSLS